MSHLHSQLFTSNGTFSIPLGVFDLYITAIAGGGGGAGSAQWNYYNGGGGGGAGQSIVGQHYSVTQLQSIGVTIGQGGGGGYTWYDGGGGSSTGTAGGAGTNTTLTGAISLTLNAGGGGAASVAGINNDFQTHAAGGSGYPAGGSGEQNHDGVGAVSSLSPYGNGGNAHKGNADSGGNGYVLIEWDNPKLGNYIIVG